MKTTQILFRQHVGRLIQFQWYIKGKVKVIPTMSEDILKSQGYEVVDIQEFLKPPRKEEEYAENFIKIIGTYDKEIPKDRNHPDYKQEPCFIHRNNEALVEGLDQAKVLTNSVEVCEGLPESLIEKERNLNLPEEVHVETKNKIKLSCMFDATQNILPRKRDPLRPSWSFVREYGITETRKNDLLCKNLSVVCEQFSENVKTKSQILDAFFSSPIVAHDKNIQFEVTSDVLVTTTKKLNSLAEPSTTSKFALPDLGPAECTIGLKPYNFYVMQDIYPTRSSSKWPFVQTALVHYNPTRVKNVIEEEVTENQIQGKSLLYGFSIAVAEARALFGSDIKNLPEPIVVPVVQTDGKMFHFTVFQLNTLDLDKGSEIKNIFWNTERTPLYSVCEYKGGRPVLEGYNPDVIRQLITFYNME